MKFNILNRFTYSVKFTAEIDCNKDESISIKIGLAVKWAVKNKADLRSANLRSANLRSADLRFADLSSADLRNTKNMVKIMGVEPGNTYWKRFEDGLCNNGYQFQVGINKLNKSEVFADDERVTCSSPGFHFASRSWCAVNYPERHLEAKIKIPLKAKINEPWATDGKASADMIEILQVFDTETGKDVTKLFKKK